MAAVEYRHMRPWRALLLWVLVLWLGIASFMVIRAQTTGWIATGAFPHQYEITQVVQAPSLKAGTTVAYTNVYVFSYYTTTYEHPILGKDGPEGIWIELAGVHVNNATPTPSGHRLGRTRIAIEDIPNRYRKQYETSKPRWHTVLKTIDPNPFILGTALNTESGRFGPSMAKRHERLWAPSILTQVLLRIALQSLLIAIIPALLLYVLIYRIIFCSMLISRRLNEDRCPVCGYPMQGILCPECGSKFQARWFLRSCRSR